MKGRCKMCYHWDIQHIGGKCIMHGCNCQLFEDEGDEANVVKSAPASEPSKGDEENLGVATNDSASNPSNFEGWLKIFVHNGNKYVSINDVIENCLDKQKVLDCIYHRKGLDNKNPDLISVKKLIHELDLNKEAKP